MNGYYLIPANSKKSILKLGIFTNFDLALFLGGVLITVILMLSIHTDSFIGMILILTPALIVSFLVFPVPNYHNVLQLIINIYTFYFVRQRTYKWKGWCYKNGSNK
jgi:xanthine/uracil/vitamin C permease (AzgA family)